MKLSILIVSYNVGHLLRRCLTELAGSESGVAARPPFEVVVVDNASTDPEVLEVRESFPSVTWVQFSRNLGFSAAVNAGAAAATGEYYLLLNPDTELSCDKVSAMVDAFVGVPGASAMGYRQVDEFGEVQLSVGLEPGYFSELGRKFLQRRFDRGGRWARAVVERWLQVTRPVSWVAGSALMVRRNDFEQIGGFDEGFFLYFEDIDFCLRLARRVGPVYFEPAITLVHRRGQSAKTNSVQAEAAYRRSQLYFWGKHRGWIHQQVMKNYLRLRGQSPD